MPRDIPVGNGKLHECAVEEKGRDHGPSRTLMMKSEIRISKLETNSKQKRETLLAAWVDMGFMFVAFEFGAFDIALRHGSGW